METECLDFLMRGHQPVVWCTASGIAQIGLTVEVERAVHEGRLCILSPFDAEVIHANSAEGIRRNEVVSAMADAVFVPHAAPGGRAEICVANALARGQRVLTFIDPANEHLVLAGASPTTTGQLAASYK